ncbi:LysR family transcriptional regulator [Polyangium sp. 6x1]|uniref:LysR family transcriptional regulator n=1 Tax=Polyangium sp. 6x1 TaxID=3042689 RepID=UPI0024824FE7|nr:LysR family transcriptional regulator [Polyangium sp. 6x1]MDI1445593.1 LysR family transcriptional regulator [Polyangium sp. 6x1]
MDLEELRAFLAVAEAGSFLAAATSLHMPRATLRRRIDQLEARAGVLLVDRTRDGVALTEAGKLLAARGRLMVQESNALLQSVREAGSEPAGVLRIVLPVGLPPHLFIHVLGIARKYPRLAFQLHFSNDPVGGLMENVDLAFHFGETSPAGPWVSRELMRVPVRLVASREYLERRGTPRSVAELSGHDLLAWEAPGEDGRSWPLLRGGTFLVSPMVTAQDIHVIRLLAVAGHGIALLPDPGIPDPEPPERQPVPVLPDVVGREIGFRVVVPAVLSEIPRIKAMLDLLEPILGKMGL